MRLDKKRRQRWSEVQAGRVVESGCNITSKAAACHTTKAAKQPGGTDRCEKKNLHRGEWGMGKWAGLGL